MLPRVALFATQAIAHGSPAQASASSPASSSEPVVPDPSAEPEPAPPLDGGDVVVVGRGDADGFHLMVPRDGAPDGWARLATLSVAGWDEPNWVGELCVTGSGHHAVVTFAPASFVNRPDLRDRGAFLAVVDVATGEIRIIPERVALKYHTPRCGTGDDAVVLRHLGVDQERTELLHLDAAAAAVTAFAEVDGQLTDAAPGGPWVVAARGSAIVGVAPDGTETVEASFDGRPFDIHPSSDGGLDFLVFPPDADRVVATHLVDGEATELATAAPSGIAVAAGRNGENRLVGEPTSLAPDAPPVLAAADGDVIAASLDGSLVVDSVEAVPDDQQATTDPLDLVITSTAGGATVSQTVAVEDAPPVSDAAAGEAGLLQTTTPKCSVGRNQPGFQVMQPLPAEVEWAANRAVQGQAVSRPQNWNKNGLPAYTSTSWFNDIQIPGGKRVPVQVLLAIAAQESNQQQAARFALPGVPGNPNIADYYGRIFTNDGAEIVGFDFTNADCGYGITQVTSHMQAGDLYYTVNEKRAIASDYAANLAAATDILEDKWNSLASLNITANGGDATKVENWYFALWAYNCCINLPSGGTNPYGLGWTNNPANADFKLDRQPFLRASYADASHPSDWAYQERVLGWAERGQFDYRGNQTFKPTVGLLMVPGIYTFCKPDKNECDPNYHATDPKLSFCKRDDRRCWWHETTTFATTGLQSEVPTDASGPEPGTVNPLNPHPPSCSAIDSDIPTTPQLVTLPTNAVIVDDVANPVATNIVGCNATPASAGTFTLGFDKDGNGVNLAEIDTHQIGAGYGGHFWFAHTNRESRPAHTVTGTWRPPATVTGWQRVLVHIPDHGADTYTAKYLIESSAGSSFRVVNQRWNENIWFDLGSFNLGTDVRVTLTNETVADHGWQPDVAWDAVAFVPSAKPVVSYVAFGDSYSAGEGLAPYLKNSAYDNDNSANRANKCHRSELSYAYDVYRGLRERKAGEDELHFVACSSAETPDVMDNGLQYNEMTQLQQGWLDVNTTHVTITIGGNDAGFGDILKGCIVAADSCLDPAFRLTREEENHVTGDKFNRVDAKGLEETEPVIIEGLRQRYRDLIDQIRAKAPNAKIVLVGYPQVIANGGASVGWTCGYILSPEERNWMDRMSNDFAAMINAVAVEKGIIAVDPRERFEGHEACALGQWINATSVTNGPASFHPTVEGHNQYGQAILEKVPAPAK